MALVTGAHVILGGLRAVIVTGVVQSVLMLVGGLIVAFVVFNLPEVGGWSGMRAMDAAAAPESQKMHLYEPSNHPTLPWTGMLSGLMVLHFFYWGTNQFIVQKGAFGTLRQGGSDRNHYRRFLQVAYSLLFHRHGDRSLLSL